MVSNLLLQITVTLKGTQCQVFIRLFYSSFSYLLGNNLLLLCLLTSIGKLPLTHSLRVRSQPYALNSEVSLQPTDDRGLFMSMVEAAPEQAGIMRAEGKLSFPCDSCWGTLASGFVVTLTPNRRCHKRKYCCLVAFMWTLSHHHATQFSPE